MHRIIKVFITLIFLLVAPLAFCQMFDVSKLHAKELKIKKVSFFHVDELEEDHLFDTLGNLTESKFHLSIYAKRLRKYNSRGKLIEDIEYDDNDSILDRCILHYNKKELPVAVFLYNAKDSILHTDSSRYTKDGREKEFIRYNSKGNVKYAFLFRYDKQGKIVSKKEVNRQKQLEFRTVFKYNTNNRLVEEITYDALGKMDVKWETNYDEKGNEIKTFCTGDCPDGGGWINKYNNENQIVEYIELNENGTVSGVFQYTYDERGNKTEITLMNSLGGIIETQKLKYNDRNLMIEKVKNGEDVYRAEYEYY